MSAAGSGSARLAAAFAQARAQGRTALVAYLMGGDGGLGATAQALSALDEAGVDVIELGIPFSDPMADGPVLQAAAARALSAGTTLPKLLELAGTLRLRAPMVAMGYANPIEQMGLGRFASALASAGLCGAIVPDVPLEEALPYQAALGAHGLAWVRLVAPTTTHARAKAIAAKAEGFLYAVSATGVTGDRAHLPADLAERLAELRKLSPAPVAVGFGISTAAQAAALRGQADGVVVGTALVRAHEQGGAKAVAGLVAELRAALGL